MIRLLPLLRLHMIALATALVPGVCPPVSAETDTTPNIGGEWDVAISGQTLKLKITQKGKDVSGTASYPKGGPVAFEISGSVDKAGALLLKLFWTEDAKEAGVSVEAWAAAVKSRPDPNHPDRLPVKEDVRLTYREDTSNVTEKLEGDLLVPVIHDIKENGKFKKLKEENGVEDSKTTAEIKRGYAARCAAEMGVIPKFSCLDGDLLPITVLGKPQTNPVPKCDKPVQLGLVDEIGQCVPFSRLVHLTTSTKDPNIITIAICRKYKGSTSETDPEFDDIAMVSHNKATGHTCFFQSPVRRKRYDGQSIPGPTDEDADRVWGERKTANDEKVGGFGPAGQRCNDCHSAGPFLWSPYVGQVVDAEKATKEWNPNGKWDSNFANMFSMPSILLRPRYEKSGNTYDNACLECHRLGNGTSCKTFANRYANKTHKFGSLEEFWMPTNYGGTDDEWHTEYDSAMEQIARCCGNPDLAECNKREAK
jgi:hypothetical protein